MQLATGSRLQVEGGCRGSSSSSSGWLGTTLARCGLPRRAVCISSPRQLSRTQASGEPAASAGVRTQHPGEGEVAQPAHAKGPGRLRRRSRLPTSIFPARDTLPSSSSTPSTSHGQHPAAQQRPHRAGNGPSAVAPPAQTPAADTAGSQHSSPQLSGNPTPPARTRGPPCAPRQTPATSGTKHTRLPTRVRQQVAANAFRNQLTQLRLPAVQLLSQVPAGLVGALAAPGTADAASFWSDSAAAGGGLGALPAAAAGPSADTLPAAPATDLLAGSLWAAPAAARSGAPVVAAFTLVGVTPPVEAATSAADLAGLPSPSSSSTRYRGEGATSDLASLMPRSGGAREPHAELATAAHSAAQQLHAHLVRPAPVAAPVLPLHSLQHLLLAQDPEIEQELLSQVPLDLVQGKPRLLWVGVHQPAGANTPAAVYLAPVDSSVLELHSVGSEQLVACLQVPQALQRPVALVDGLIFQQPQQVGGVGSADARPLGPKQGAGAAAAGLASLPSWAGEHVSPGLSSSAAAGLGETGAIPTGGATDVAAAAVGAAKGAGSFSSGGQLHTTPGWYSYLVQVWGEWDAAEEGTLFPNMLRHCADGRTAHNMRHAADLAAFLAAPQRQRLEEHAVNLVRLAFDRHRQPEWVLERLASMWGGGALLEFGMDRQWVVERGCKEAAQQQLYAVPQAAAAGATGA